MHLQALAWLGYLEHATPWRLWSFTENAGKGGCTIFAEMLLREQGVDLMGLPWCATFVHAVLRRPDVLGRAHPGCRVLWRRLRRKGLLRGPSWQPQPGDLIFCRNRRRIDHVGIVEECRGTTVSSIDGNTVDPTGFFPPGEGGAVARRTRERTDPRIAGYGAISEVIGNG